MNQPEKVVSATAERAVFANIARFHEAAAMPASRTRAETQAFAEGRKAGLMSAASEAQARIDTLEAVIVELKASVVTLAGDIDAKLSEVMIESLLACLPSLTEIVTRAELSKLIERLAGSAGLGTITIRVPERYAAAIGKFSNQNDVSIETVEDGHAVTMCWTSGSAKLDIEGRTAAFTSALEAALHTMQS